MTDRMEQPAHRECVPTSRATRQHRIEPNSLLMLAFVVPTTALFDNYSIAVQIRSSSCSHLPGPCRWSSTSCGMPSLPTSDSAKNRYPPSWPVSFCTSSAFPWSFIAPCRNPDFSYYLGMSTARRKRKPKWRVDLRECIRLYKDELVPSRIPLALIAIGMPLRLAGGKLFRVQSDARSALCGAHTNHLQFGTNHERIRNPQ
jgi:hypothetical protein